MILIAAATGALLAAGLAGLVYLLLPASLTALPEVPQTDRPPRVSLAHRARAGLARVPRRTRIQLGVGLGAGVVGWLIAGWPLLVLVGPVITFGLPALLSNQAQVDQIARLEALEEWTRSLARSLATGKGLEDALQASAATAPGPIKPQVRALAARLESHTNQAAALVAFADDLADPTADMVAQSLITAIELRGPVSMVLDDLADDVGEQVRARREVEASRATYRTTATWLTVITVGTIVVMLLNGTYIAPYKTPLGQLVFLTLAGLYALTLLWFNRMSNGPGPARIFTPRRRTPTRTPRTPLAGGTGRPGHGLAGQGGAR